MVEFLQSYGLWIALAGVFVAMHWFGRGCCGGGHRQRPTQDSQGLPGQTEKAEKTSEGVPKSTGGCH